MPDTAGTIGTKSPILDDLVETMSGAVIAAEAYFEAAKSAASRILVVDGKPDRKALTEHQHLAHGLAWACDLCRNASRNGKLGKAPRCGRKFR